MISEQYACAYKEVIELLKYVPLQDVEKIPANIIAHLLKNKDENYEYHIDKNKSFDEQEKSEITKAIFAIFFRDYWATEYQRERILQKEKADEIKIEEEKRNKYNPDDIFKKKKIHTIIDNTENNNLVVYKKKNIIKKIMDKLLHLFNK